MNSLVAARPTSVFAMTGFIRSKLQQRFGMADVPGKSA